MITSARYRLRRATSADVPVLVRHRVGMWESIGHHTPAQLRAHGPAYARWLRPRLRSGELEAWVARQGKEAVASGALWWRPDQPRPGAPRSIPYILSMYTMPSARGQGIATAIVRKLLRTPRAKGVDRVILHASAEGRVVYERLGFEPTNEMRLWLRRPPWAGKSLAPAAAHSRASARRSPSTPRPKCTKPRAPVGPPR